MEGETSRKPKRSLELTSFAPKRPPKHLNLSHSMKDELMDQPIFSTEKKEEPDDDSFGLSHISSSKENEKCYICNKPLHLFSETRRLLHVNTCLDRQETARNQEIAMDKFKNTIDCPICSIPFPPGPHREAHFKSCAKKNSISGVKLLELVKTQEKVTAVRKNNNLKHTSAPIPKARKVIAPKLPGQPKNVNDEGLQMAMALSNSLIQPSQDSIMEFDDFRERSVQFTKLPDKNEKRRKRPKSFDLIEFAPRSCKCQVLSVIQSRFIDAFKLAIHVPKDIEHLTQRVDSQAKYQRRLVEKLNRYERLSDDFSTLFEQGTHADVHITCSDGVIPAHKVILLARTRGLVEKGEKTIRMEERKEIVSMWMRYIYTGRQEWSPGHEDAIQALAQKYGPDSLLYIYSQKTKPAVKLNEIPDERLAMISEVIQDIPKPSSIVETEEIFNVMEETLNKVENDMEDTVCGILDGTNPYDGEDPMQGINLNASEALIENVDDEDCIIIENDDHDKKVHPKKEDCPEIQAETSDDVILGSPDVFEQPNISSNNDVKAPWDNETPKAWHMTPLIVSKLEVEEIVQKSPEQVNISHEMPVFEYDDWNDNPAGIMFNSVENTPQSIKKTSFTRTKSMAAVEETPKSTGIKRIMSLQLSSIKRIENVDSFDNTPELTSITPNRLQIPLPTPLATSTPMQPVNKKLRFGSDVKILKTTNITPMPNYGTMDDAQLKTELARHGLRPMGKKRAIQKLTEIYEQTHPEIDPSTPTIRPLRILPGVKEADEEAETGGGEPQRKTSIRQPIFQEPPNPSVFLSKNVSPIKTINSDSGSENDDIGGHTLNSEAEEPAEETVLADPASLPKNLPEMTATLLNWLRKKENSFLYNHMLGLNPVLLEELHSKISNADDPVCTIPKKALASILDSLGITFSLPLTSRGRGNNGGARFMKQKKKD